MSAIPISPIYSSANGTDGTDLSLCTAIYEINGQQISVPADTPQDLGSVLTAAGLPVVQPVALSDLTTSVTALTADQQAALLPAVIAWALTQSPDLQNLVASLVPAAPTALQPVPVPSPINPLPPTPGPGPAPLV